MAITNNLKILQWNIQSSKSNLTIFNIYKFYIRNYSSIIRKDRKADTEGLATFVHKKYNFDILNDRNNYNSKFQTSVIFIQELKLTFSADTWDVVISIYK